MKQKEKKCQDYMDRADDHIRTMHASREFNDLEMSSIVCDLPGGNGDMDSGASRSENERLKAENEALRAPTKITDPTVPPRIDSRSKASEIINKNVGRILS